MDETDRKILQLLSEDSRRSLADIGGLISMSASSVNERIRRLSASGAIRRFTIDADPKALGLGVAAFVWVGLSQSADESQFQRFAADHPAICECHHVTGAWSYLVKIRVASLDEIEAFLTEMKQQAFLARSETIIALSTVVDAPFGVAKQGSGRKAAGPQAQPDKPQPDADTGRGVRQKAARRQTRRAR